MKKKSNNRISWEKQVKRLKNAMKAVKKEGYKVSFEIPEAPKRITKQAINKLKNVTRNTLRRTSDYFVQPETGEYFTTQERREQGRKEKQEIRSRKKALKDFAKARTDYFSFEIDEEQYNEAFNKYTDTLTDTEKNDLAGLRRADYKARQELYESTDDVESDTINEDIYTDIGRDHINFLNSFSSIAQGAEYVKNAILNITKDMSIIGQAYSATVSDYGDFTFNEAYNISLATTWLEEFIRHMPEDMQNYYDENRDLFENALQDLDTGDDYDY